MRRKVVKLGPATLVVSLPSKWTKKFSINAGDELEMEEHNKNLIISTEKGINIEKEAIDISNWDHLT